jgi:DNA-binding MarR family transcriptional regulator/N-acetylglutamate synthase-like GNAT family acetyltransferase
MTNDRIDTLRQLSRKLVRELGMLQLNSPESGQTPQHWHALMEIQRAPGITISALAGLLLLSVSSMSRIVAGLVKQGYVTMTEGADKREKALEVTPQGLKAIRHIDDFSNAKIRGAFAFLTEDQQQGILDAIETYGAALENSRRMTEGVKILKLGTSRVIRKQIIAMIETIQREEFNIPVTPALNIGILRAEEEYYANNSYNFWYAINQEGTIIGSIGLKQIDPSRVELKKFFVTQAYRGKGIAQDLLKKAAASANKQGYKEMYLGTVDVLKGAHRFYEKFGFKRISKDQLPKNFQLTAQDTQFFKGEVKELL